MLPTPSTAHVNYDRIYEPAEDSYLLLDTLSSPAETNFLHRRFPASSPSPIVVEIGTGSGVVLAFVNAHASTIFGRRDVLSMGTDVNEFACRATVQTVERAAREAPRSSGCFIGSGVGDLASSLKARCVDFLIFNPPYVPTEELPGQRDLAGDADVLTASAMFERDSYLLSLSYAGGRDGMETTNRLLAQIPAILSDRGVAYILLCAQNKPNAVIAYVRTWQGGGWSAEHVGSSGNRAGWEKLCILRIWRKCDERD